MLQWMGGSRRKVAASHTSVKKRQKQYFEQRRRQQHQFTAGSGSCSNDRNSSNQHQSLDILNFINLSTPATPECKPSRPEDVKQVVGDRDASFYSLKDNITGEVHLTIKQKLVPQRGFRLVSLTTRQMILRKRTQQRI